MQLRVVHSIYFVSSLYSTKETKCRPDVGASRRGKGAVTCVKLALCFPVACYGGDSFIAARKMNVLGVYWGVLGVRVKLMSCETVQVRYSGACPRHEGVYGEKRYSCADLTTALDGS